MAARRGVTEQRAGAESPPARPATHPHLEALAREARPAGSKAEERARGYASRELERLGFSISREVFTFSDIPGRYGTPIGGALAALTVLAAACAGLCGRDPVVAMSALAGGLVLLGIFTRFMLDPAALAMPWMRAESCNLVATRGSGDPTVWLMAHLDSKSQPVSSLVRGAGIVTLLAAIAVAIGAAAWQLDGHDAGFAWLVAVGFALFGGIPVAASVVGVTSNGAVDNASGVAAVLAAAAMLEPRARVGVVLTSAEELGLAGARAWTTTRTAGVALNCDGVDDEGDVTIMYSARRPERLLETIAAHLSAGTRVRRMPVALLTDSVALADRRWQAITVSRGSFATLRRVHTAGDDLAAMTGRGIPEVATLLARASEALAR